MVAELFCKPRQTEIRNAHVSFAVNHDVRRLQVSVQDAVGVRGRESRAELARNLYGLIRRKPPYALQERCQLLSLYELHREKMVAVDFAYVVNAADVAMRDLSGDSNFTMKARERRTVVKQSFWKKLQSNRLRELQIVCTIDFSHAAFAEQPYDTIARGQDCSGDETRVVYGIVGRDGPGRQLRESLIAVTTLFPGALLLHEGGRGSIGHSRPARGAHDSFAWNLL
jgi:hypothetical protein